ncbi:MAG: PEP-CTERM sorting domain-containing protein [Verrucomicrobiota bacterium]|nr:PEP-CTERM sorting domain-containing protein [Verrucomicrobiota bacterium]
MKFTSFIALGVCALLVLAAASASAAPLQNGGFETGSFSPWTTAGVDTVTGTSNSVAPVEGSFQAVIDTPHSGTATQAQLESFLGLASGTTSVYNSAGGQGGGSAFGQTFDVTSGQIITFQWDFLPNGNDTNSGQNDTAFFTLHLASDTSSSVIFTLSSTATSGGNPTGYQTYLSSPLAAGTYFLGFALNDQKTPVGAYNAQRPTLLIDNVSAIPEPSTFALLALGGVAGAASLLRRRKAS